MSNPTLKCGCLVASVLLFGIAPSLRAAVIHVPADQATIQAAINVATNGDTVLVSPGTYFENIDFLGRDVAVISESGPEVTIMDGGGADSVVTITSTVSRVATLKGFTIRNGYEKGNGAGLRAGGGIRIASGGPTIVGNVITNNRATFGAGVAISLSSALVQSNSIVHNSLVCACAGAKGAGIGIEGSAEILDNVIADNDVNSVGDGGGIALDYTGASVIRGNEGGGIWIYSACSPDIVENLIVGNHSFWGGGVFWCVGPGERGPRLVNNTIADNVSDYLRDEIFGCSYQAQTELINNIIIGPQGGTAVYCSDTAAGVIESPIFKSNNVFSPDGTAYGGFCGDQTGMNGNISVDPLQVFVCRRADDYRLRADSPCVDVGDNSAPNLPETDIDGHPRILDGNDDHLAVVDLGAFEFNVADAPIPCLEIRCLTNVVQTAYLAERTTVVPYPTPPASPGATVICSPPSGSAFPVGTTTVTCTVTDDVERPDLHVPRGG